MAGGSLVPCSLRYSIVFAVGSVFTCCGWSQRLRFVTDVAVCHRYCGLSQVLCHKYCGLSQILRFVTEVASCHNVAVCHICYRIQNTEILLSMNNIEICLTTA